MTYIKIKVFCMARKSIKISFLPHNNFIFYNKDVIDFNLNYIDYE